MKKILVGFAVLILSACTNQDATLKTLRASGFKDIQIGGYSFACSKDDSYCTKFTATNPNGETVSGAVGCGYWLKGCTIRF